MSNDEPLGGGMANPGAVFRRGDSVLRPAPASWPALHPFLRGLRAEGFVQAPVPTGPVVDGVEELEFLPGEVPIEPLPAWADDEPILASVGTLLRKYHAAAGGVPFDASAPWSTELADPQGGPLLCHNDVCHENVVFREGNARAIIDFDFAAPGRREYDLATMARMCVPIEPDEDAARSGRGGLDPAARLRLVADAYGLDRAGRRTMVTALAGSIERGGEFVRRRVDAGEAAFIEMWNSMGGQERFDLREHRFVGGLLPPGGDP